LHKYTKQALAKHGMQHPAKARGERGRATGRRESATDQDGRLARYPLSRETSRRCCPCEDCERYIYTSRIL